MSSNGFYAGKPRIEQLPVGQMGDATFIPAADFDHCLKVVDRLPLAPVWGFLECFPQSPVSMVFSLQQSTDNAQADAYSAINIRVNGASVASVTVVPGGRVFFLVETQTEDWLKFVTSTQRAAYGRITVGAFNASFIRHFMEQSP